MEDESTGRERDSRGRFAPKDGDTPPPDASDDAKVVERGSGEMPENETAMERIERTRSGDLREGEWTEDISDTTAPSIGPDSVIVHHEARNDDHDRSVDAMGQDKHRQVVGQSYGPSKARQLSLYGVFIAIVIALFIGGKIAVDHFDKAPSHNKDQAPWSASNAKQHTPQRFVDVQSNKPANAKPVNP
jgi:hypothetical protein